MTKPMRSTNITMRATEHEKGLLEKAAQLAGFSNLTNFMMTAARKEAFRIINDMNTINLSAKNWDIVSQLLSNPPEPNENLKELLSTKNKEVGCEKSGHRKTK